MRRGIPMQVDIRGDFIPAALVQLGPGEQIYCESGLDVYMDQTIQPQIRALTQGGLTGIVRRVVGGIPFHLVTFSGPGSVAFSRFSPGEIRSLELGPGETVDVAEHSLLLATETVGYDVVYVKGTGRVGRMVGFFLDRLRGPGTIVFHGHGNVLSFNLAPGEGMQVDHGALLMKDSTVQVQSYNQPLGGGLTGHALSFEALQVQGPGRVLLQTLDPSRQTPA
jgi:uncharacterized protein (AIM24 family)